jgi:hypothetical protein
MMNEARQITAENIAEVAEWCGRTVGIVDTPHDFSQHVVIRMNLDDIAVVGDWIVKTDNGKFKAVTDEEYLAIQLSEEADASRFAKVLAIVKEAMLKQDAATYHGEGASTGTDRVAEEATQKILEIM